MQFPQYNAQYLLQILYLVLIMAAKGDETHRAREQLSRRPHMFDKLAVVALHYLSGSWQSGLLQRS